MSISGEEPCQSCSGLSDALRYDLSFSLAYSVFCRFYIRRIKKHHRSLFGDAAGERDHSRNRQRIWGAVRLWTASDVVWGACSSRNTWLAYMARLHGSLTWLAYMARLHGSLTWLADMAR